MTIKISAIAVWAIILFGCNHPQNTNMNTVAQPTFTSGYAPIGALKMYYEIHGTGGIPLVLLHGGGSTIQTTFGNILDSLAKNRQVIAVELQAHGHTADIDRPLSFEQDADDVAALLNYLNIKKADLFGFSNGGNTAMQVGIRHPGIVNKLVIASAFYQRDGMVPGFFDWMQHASLENMPMPLQTAYLQIDSNKQHLQAMHDRDRDRMVQFRDWPDEMLKSIKSPVLLICGDKDVVLTEHTLKMSHFIPKAELLIVPGNHGSFIGEICNVKSGSKQPQVMVAMIEEFLDGQ